MRKYLLSLAVAATALMNAGAANAQVSVNFTEGGGTPTPYEFSIANFNDYTLGGFTGDGQILTGSDWTQGADPGPAVGDAGDPYLSVLANKVASINFTSYYGGGLRQLSFDYGSADTYNQFTVFYTGGLGFTMYTGAAIAAAATGSWTSPKTNGRVTFTALAGSTITGLSLSSSQNSLETDNYAGISAVPEPATWAMLLLGFGAIGFQVRRRRDRLQVRYA